MNGIKHWLDCPFDLKNKIIFRQYFFQVPLQISFLILSKFERIIYLLFLLKSVISGGTEVNPFQANVPLMEKPGGWFLLAKCVKNTCGRVKKMALFHKCFSHILLVKTIHLVFP